MARNNGSRYGFDDGPKWSGYQDGYPQPTFTGTEIGIDPVLLSGGKLGVVKPVVQPVQPPTPAPAAGTPAQSGVTIFGHKFTWTQLIVASVVGVLLYNGSKG